MSGFFTKSQTITSNSFADVSLSWVTLKQIKCVTGDTTNTWVIKVWDISTSNISVFMGVNDSYGVDFDIQDIRVTNISNQLVYCSFESYTTPDVYKTVWDWGMAITTFFMILFFFILPYYVAVRYVLFIDNKTIEKLKEKLDNVKQKYFTKK